MVTEGLVTLEKMQVIKYGADPPGWSASCATTSKSPHPPSDQATPVSTDGLAHAFVAMLLSRAVQPRSYRRRLEGANASLALCRADPTPAFRAGTAVSPF